MHFVQRVCTSVSIQREWAFRQPFLDSDKECLKYDDMPALPRRPSTGEIYKGLVKLGWACVAACQTGQFVFVAARLIAAGCQSGTSQMSDAGSAQTSRPQAIVA